jgi:hypothetical protein
VTTPDVDAAGQFLAANARVLDRRRFERLFLGGDPDLSATRSPPSATPTAVSVTRSSRTGARRPASRPRSRWRFAPSTRPTHGTRSLSRAHVTGSRPTRRRRAARRSWSRVWKAGRTLRGGSRRKGGRHRSSPPERVGVRSEVERRVDLAVGNRVERDLRDGRWRGGCEGRPRCATRATRSRRPAPRQPVERPASVGCLLVGEPGFPHVH